MAVGDDKKKKKAKKPKTTTTKSKSVVKKGGNWNLGTTTTRTSSTTKNRRGRVKASSSTKKTVTTAPFSNSRLVEKSATSKNGRVSRSTSSTASVGDGGKHVYSSSISKTKGRKKRTVITKNGDRDDVKYGIPSKKSVVVSRTPNKKGKGGKIKRSTSNKRAVARATRRINRGGR